MDRILIVDDDRQTCEFISELIQAPGRQVDSALDPSQATRLALANHYDVAVCDINLNADLSGLDLLRQLKRANEHLEIILISGFGTLETAIEAVREGAFDYISKPFNIGEVKSTVERALRQKTLERDEGAGGLPEEQPRGISGLIGRSGRMLAVYKQIALAADSRATVLITGESGTGKELVARAIHVHGPRSHRPFVTVNCGAVTETLLESELFGHARGAFTGAVADKKGLFEQANGGTIFLDEVGDTSAAMQVKLLRALEDGSVRPVGGAQVVRVDVRVIAATNHNLEEEVREGRFREDLFYRLNIVAIALPPLRERREDIPLLVTHFLRVVRETSGHDVRLTNDALDALLAYAWPGNVREIENTIERMALFCRGGVIEASDLPEKIRQVPAHFESRLFADLPTLDEIEKRYLHHVLESVGGNKKRAAEILGIDRRTLYRMAERFGLDIHDESQE